MQSANPRRNRIAGVRLTWQTIQEHRVGIGTWVVGGGIFNAFETYALHVEMTDFAGGPTALAASVMPAIEAMRPLRWPADRLDTLGGYLTYHNILMFQCFLALYAAVQGVHLIRGLEAQHRLEVVLATGWSRLAVLRDRMVGLVVSILIIALGLGLSIAAAFAWVGEPDTANAFVSLFAVGVCAVAAATWGVFVSQFVRSERSGIGLAVLPLIVVYIVTNESENLGPLGLLRYLGPFHWANGARALVPGLHTEYRGLIVLVAIAIICTMGAALAMQQRDYDNALWWRRSARAPIRRTTRAQRWWLGTILRSQLWRHRVVLLAWAAGTAALAGLWMSLEPTVATSWSKSEFFVRLLGGRDGAPVGAIYTSFGCDTMAPIVLAYAVSHAASWNSDLHQGRLEHWLAAPVSWAMLIRGRLFAAAIGTLAVTSAWLSAGAITARIVDAPLDAAGYGRALVMCWLLGCTGAALAALLVSWTRNTWATSGLIMYIVVAYVLGWFVTTLHWPEWLRRLSVLEAYAHPYQRWPDASDIWLLLAVMTTAGFGAVIVASRTPKVDS